MKKACVACGEQIDIEKMHCPKCGKRQDTGSLGLSAVNMLYILMGVALLFWLLSFMR